MPAASRRRSTRWPEPSRPCEGDPHGSPFSSCSTIKRNDTDMREGSLEAPTRHALDWQNPWFWDEKALEAEMERVFDICHGCRRCFNLCDSFPRLFDLIDNGPTGELDGVKKEDYAQVEEACTLCDMCFMTKCPYVPPHEWALDFPHLMLRHRAVQARKKGIGFVDAPARRHRPQRPARHLRRRPRQLGDRRAQQADAPGHGAVGRHPSRRAPAALRRRDLRDPRRARERARSTRPRPPSASARPCSTPPAS